MNDKGNDLINLGKKRKDLIEKKNTIDSEISQLTDRYDEKKIGALIFQNWTRCKQLDQLSQAYTFYSQSIPLYIVNELAKTQPYRWQWLDQNREIWSNSENILSYLYQQDVYAKFTETWNKNIELNCHGITRVYKQPQKFRQIDPSLNYDINLHKLSYSTWNYITCTIQGWVENINKEIGEKVRNDANSINDFIKSDFHIKVNSLYDTKTDVDKQIDKIEALIKSMKIEFNID